MPTFNDGENLGSVRTKINAAITTVDNLEAQGGNLYAAYETRAEAVAAIAGGLSVPDGGVLSASGLMYLADDSSTDIPDMPGFVPLGNAFVDHWAENTTPGTTNMADALANALAYGDDVHLLNRAYLFSRSSGFWSASGINLIGPGKHGPQVTFRRDATSGAINFIRLTNALVIDCNIAMDSTNPTDTGTLSFALPNGDNTGMLNCSFDGGATGSNWDGNVFIASDVTGGDSGLVKDCDFVNIGWFFLKTNSATSAHNKWKILNNRFVNMRKPATVNSPNGDAIDWLWQGNSFDTNSNTGGFGHISGCAGGDGFRFIGNYFTGDCDECLHFEEATRWVVAGNVADVGGSFVQALESTVGTGTAFNDECVITGNTAKGGKTANENGIWFVDDGGGPSGKRVTITGNTLRGFDRGISLGDQYGGDNGNIIANNSVYDCNTGISTPDAHYGIRDNDLINCTTGIEVTSRGGALGRHRFVNVTTAVSPSVGPVSIDGAVVEMDEFSLPTGDQDIDLIALPQEFAVRVTINAHFSGSNYLYLAYDAVWDGTTETGFDTEVISVTSGSVSSPDLTQDGTNLQFNVNNLSGAAQTTRLSVLIDGPMIYT